MVGRKDVNTLKVMSRKQMVCIASIPGLLIIVTNVFIFFELAVKTAASGKECIL